MSSKGKISMKFLTLNFLALCSSEKKREKINVKRHGNFINPIDECDAMGISCTWNTSSAMTVAVESYGKNERFRRAFRRIYQAKSLDHT